MADVFISYAREDREFARRLVEELKHRGRQSWIDWEGIEPSDHWWRSVTEAIDTADAVVFITSPDSLVSEVCLREIRHAAAQNKRLVPVVCRDVEGLDVPEEIAEVNWVFLRAEDDWIEGSVKLERALQLDLELVRVHTRVLTRAEAWRLSGRRPTPLLRGDELRAAEQWLARAAVGGEPQPTELQTEFILASRHQAASRQRLAIAGALAVAAVAIGLSIFAFIQRSQARHEARLAESRQLAASAEADLTSSPEQAITLAARGLRIAPTLQAEHALWSALQNSRLRAQFVGHSPVKAVAFTSGGRDLAVGSDDGRVRLWRLADHRLLWTATGKGAASELVFSSLGGLVLVARNSISASNFSQTCTVQVVDAATGSPEHTLGPFASNCFFALVPGTSTVVIGTFNGTLESWDIETGQPIGPPRQVSPETALATAVAASPAGRELAFLTSNQVRLLDAGTFRPITSMDLPNPFNANAVAFSPDGSLLLISGEYGAQITNLVSGQVSSLYAQNGSTTGAVWSPDGHVLASAAGFIGVDVWSSSTRLVDVFGGSSSQGFDAVAFSPTGLLAAGSQDGSVRVWAANPDLPDHMDPTPTGLALTQGYGAPAAHLAVFGDARYGVLVVGDAGQRLAVLYPRGDGPLAVASNGELAFTRDGSLDLWRLPGGQPARSWKLTGGAVPAAIAVSADGRIAATVTAGGTIAVFSPRATRTTRFSPSSNPDVLPALSISPDGHLLAVTTRSGVEILDTRDLRVVDRQPGVAVSFSPAGDSIAIQRSDLSIALLQTGDWRLETTIGGEPSMVDQLSFSPDGRLLAAIGSRDGALQIWDARDGTRIASRQVIESSLQAQRTEPPPVVLTAAGDALVPGPEYPGLSVYDVCHGCFDPSALLGQADARLREIAPVDGPG